MRILIIPAFLLFSIGFMACSGAEADGPGGPGAAGGWTRGGGGFGGESRAVSVMAYQSRIEPISTYLLTNTSLESIRKVEVFPRLNAQVLQILVEEGSRVREGQVLARLDEREFRIEFAQAQIALEQAEVALRQVEVRSILSKANHERALSLYEQKLISRQEYDQVVLTDRTDELSLEAARQQESAARARLEAAQMQLDYTEVLSPMDGIVTQRAIDVGTRVNPNQIAFVVEQFNPLWARIFVPERDLPQIRENQPARVRVETYPNEAFSGVIKMINPTVDSGSGTVKVTIEITAHRNLLRPGMFGTVFIETETRPSAVVIPRKAVVRERDQNFVFVVKEDSLVEKRSVTLGISEEERVEIASGLAAGESVVTVGYEGLSDGYAVSIIGWEGGPPGQPLVAARSAESEQVEGAAAQLRPQAGPAAPRASTEPARIQERPATGAAGGQQGRGNWAGGGEMSPDRLRAMEERMLSNPAVKQEYEARLKQDPELATNPEKRRAFFMEVMQRMREQGGGRRP